MHTFTIADPIAMRYVILLSLLCVSVITSARDLFVVLYTSDAEVVDMYCETDQMNAVRSPVIYRSMVLTRGTVSWHAVGGVPPYTDLRAEQGPGGLVTVTVMDAACNTYTACGIIGVNRISKMVNCSDDEPQSFTAAPLPVTPAPRANSSASVARDRTIVTERVTRATSGRPTPTSTPQRTAVRTEGLSRPAPRPTSPAPKRVAQTTTRTR